MQKTIIFIFLVTTLTKANGQCNIQSNDREDGLTVKYIRPERVGYDEDIMLALGLQTNGVQYYISTITLFKNYAVNLNGELKIKFLNNRSNQFRHYRSEKTTYRGFPATISLFVVENTQISNVINSDINLAVLQLEDGTYKSIKFKMNKDILRSHYSCLSITNN